MLLGKGDILGNLAATLQTAAMPGLLPAAHTHARIRKVQETSASSVALTQATQSSLVLLKNIFLLVKT
jgi:hypothetical protein